LEKLSTLSIDSCDEETIALVMDFIGKEWSQNHILAKDLDLMKWQHGTNTNSYNWILGINGRSVSGVLGFIPISKFDSSVVNNDFVWLALWKVREEAHTRGLGLRLLREVISAMPVSGFGVLGINPDHLSLYKSLGFTVGQLKQFYMVNSDTKQSLIANPLNEPFPQAKCGDAILKLLDKEGVRNVSVKSDNVTVPFKSLKYFENRFFSHPIYKYQVYVIQQDSFDKAIIATRIAEHEGAKVLRIVDFFGCDSILAHCGIALQTLMEIHSCEYCDFWQHGVLDDVLIKCGFGNASMGSIIVPNFFEPFVQKAAPVSFAIKSSISASFKIFRADGDQDRPNLRAVNP
jgi:hypothetical protein